jgi:hypothetical protein
VARIGMLSSGLPASTPPPNSGVTNEISYSRVTRPDDRTAGGCGQSGMLLELGIFLPRAGLL